jgi:3-deoxy-D-manno-octulosonate 8-phosphate phosphatase (KDO 8-P phosphatase)
MSPEERARQIELVVFDVDGVLTDGGLWYGPEGEAIKRFDVKDGHAMVLARLVGLPVALLTARTSPIVEARAAELKLAKVFQGRRLKGPAFEELCAEMKVAPAHTAYMGDDVNDLPALALAGLSACPGDAVAEVRQAVQLVCASPGGRGAARELLELVLKARGLWPAALEHCGVRPA